MLPRKHRLRKDRDFRAVFFRSRSSLASGGASVRANAQMTLHVRRHFAGKTGLPQARILRFGITVSKKVAKRAHDRNRLKRRLSEIVRTELIPSYTSMRPLDCVVVVKKPALDASFAELSSELMRLLAEAGVTPTRTTDGGTQ